MSNNALKTVLTWGTYDLSKPRVRILKRALDESDLQVNDCHVDVWGGVADKSQVKGAKAKLLFALRWLFAYPRLTVCWLRQRKPDVVFVGYLGQIDVLVLWPLAKLRGVPIVWDAFLSLYNTVVEDRQMVSPKHPLARLLYALEWLACRAADRVILDTRAHADYFVERFHIPREKTDAVFVGAEMDKFQVPQRERDPQQPFTVLFYGQFIPLHGIPTIIEAARLLADQPIRWVIIGKGQEEQRIANMLEQQPLSQLEWIPWVEYEQLIDHVAQADVCLGIFDDGGKASRVIPNKVFQILAAGKPLITRDSPAMRELVAKDSDGCVLVPPRDPRALSKAVLRLQSQSHAMPLHQDLRSKFSLPALQLALLQSFHQST